MNIEHKLEQISDLNAKVIGAQFFTRKLNIVLEFFERYKEDSKLRISIDGSRTNYEPIIEDPELKEEIIAIIESYKIRLEDKIMKFDLSIKY